MNDNAINMYDEINNGKEIIDYNNNDNDILIIRQQPSLTQYDINYFDMYYNRNIRYA